MLGEHLVRANSRISAGDPLRADGSLREIHYAAEGFSLRLCALASLRLILDSRISIRTESLFPFVAQIRIRSEYQLAKLDGFGFLSQRSENFNAPRPGF